MFLSFIVLWFPGKQKLSLIMLCFFWRKLFSTNSLTTSCMAKRTSKSSRKSHRRSRVKEPLVMLGNGVGSSFVFLYTRMRTLHAFLPIVSQWPTGRQDNKPIRRERQGTKSCNWASESELEIEGFKIYKKKNKAKGNAFKTKQVILMNKTRCKQNFWLCGYQEEDNRTLMQSLPPWRDQLDSTPLT